MHADVLSLAMKEALPFLLAATPKSETARQAIGMLKEWNGEMRRELPQPLILAAWWRELTKRIYADELGEAFHRSEDDAAHLFERQRLHGHRNGEIGFARACGADAEDDVV